MWSKIYVFNYKLMSMHCHTKILCVAMGMLDCSGALLHCYLKQTKQITSIDRLKPGQCCSYFFCCLDIWIHSACVFSVLHNNVWTERLTILNLVMHAVMMSLQQISQKNKIHALSFASYLNLNHDCDFIQLSRCIPTSNILCQNALKLLFVSETCIDSAFVGSLQIL